MNQKTLEKEVGEYNELIKEIQTTNQTLAEKEQARLLKLGRIQYIQEQLSLEKSIEPIPENKKSGKK